MAAKLTGEQIERLRKRLIAEPCLSPLHGDSPETRAAIHEIHNFIRALGPDATPEHYKDKLGEWRRQLRASRYGDWRSAQGIEAPSGGEALLGATEGESPAATSGSDAP